MTYPEFPDTSYIGGFFPKNFSRNFKTFLYKHFFTLILGRGDYPPYLTIIDGRGGGGIRPPHLSGGYMGEVPRYGIIKNPHCMWGVGMTLCHKVTIDF